MTNLTVDYENLEFNEKEMEQIKFALDYLHDADLSDYGDDNIKILEGIMDKLNMKYLSWF